MVCKCLISRLSLIDPLYILLNCCVVFISGRTYLYILFSVSIVTPLLFNVAVLCVFISNWLASRLIMYVGVFLSPVFIKIHFFLFLIFYFNLLIIIFLRCPIGHKQCVHRSVQDTPFILNITILFFSFCYNLDNIRVCIVAWLPPCSLQTY